MRPYIAAGVGRVVVEALGQEVEEQRRVLAQDRALGEGLEEPDPGLDALVGRPTAEDGAARQRLVFFLLPDRAAGEVREEGVGHGEGEEEAQARARPVAGWVEDRVGPRANRSLAAPELAALVVAVVVAVVVALALAVVGVVAVVAIPRTAKDEDDYGSFGRGRYDFLLGPVQPIVQVGLEEG